MIKNRLIKLEQKLQPVLSSRYVDESGWHVIGGGKGAAGVLHTPPVLTSEQWLNAGE